MSGFCGILQLDGAAAELQPLRRMDLALQAWGEAGVPWLEGPLALAGRVRKMTVEQWQEPSVLLEADLALVGHVRLDDRPMRAAIPGCITGRMADGCCLPAALRLCWRIRR